MALLLLLINICLVYLAYEFYMKNKNVGAENHD